MNDAIQIRREECRHAVRAYLAERPALAFRAQAIVRGVRDEGGFTIDEVNAALIFLEGLEPAQVRRENDTLGATLAWQITSTGTLAHERT